MERDLKSWYGKSSILTQTWKSALPFFLRREWKSAFASSLASALLGISVHILISDGGVSSFVRTSLKTHAISVSRVLPYSQDLLAFAVICIVVCIGFASSFVRRSLRSWLVGCISGIPLCFGLSTLALFLQPRGVTLRSLGVCICAMGIFFAISFGLHLNATARRRHRPNPMDLRVRTHERRGERNWNHIGDEPISSWAQDILGRAPIVDIITNKALAGGASVIALSGPLGIGKSSVLNLLQTHLEDKAIVVRFVTWLPGSQDVLSSYLLADIATECEKKYVVPGLRRSTRRVAKALAETVPTLKGLIEFLPTTTQRDDVKALASALKRLPQRVVVLLDELDRMEKDEVLTLVKMLRGLTELPNCTFVCALDLDELIRTMRGESNQAAYVYVEKFFPITVPLPRLDGATLQKVGVDKVVEALKRVSWFTGDAIIAEFEKNLTECWTEMVTPLCGTLRSVGLLATNIDISASLLRRQVDPLDLTLIEVLRRFRPTLYALIARSKLALTGGTNWVRGGEYVSDTRVKREETLFKESFAALLEPNDGEAVRALLARIFPNFNAINENLNMRQRAKHDNDQAISDPEMFSAYFQFELPEGIFSTLELDDFLREFQAEPDGYGRAKVFAQALRDLPKQSLRRDDFLRKLSVVAAEFSKSDAKRLALTAVREAKEYTYDLFAGFGEAGHVTRIVIRTAEKMDHDERVSFLKECIEVANDDTLAVRVLSTLTNPNTDVRLGVKNEELRPAFIDRMRRQYGPEADARRDLTTSDPEAFLQWGWVHPDAEKDTEDRRIQRDFWLRRIGQSRKRLAEVFDTFIMPRKFAYPNDPAPVVENTLSIATLENLFNELPDDEVLNDVETRAFDRMRRLIAGEYKNGVPMSEIG